MLQELTPAQCRMARGALGWSRIRLARESNLTAETLASFESRRARLHPNHLRALRDALCGEGVEFFLEPDGRVCVRFDDKPLEPENPGETKASS